MDQMPLFDDNQSDDNLDELVYMSSDNLLQNLSHFVSALWAYGMLIHSYDKRLGQNVFNQIAEIELFVDDVKDLRSSAVKRIADVKKTD